MFSCRFFDVSVQQNCRFSDHFMPFPHGILLSSRTNQNKVSQTTVDSSTVPQLFPNWERNVGGHLENFHERTVIPLLLKR
jgi:hypothetical protein